jgi:hypothetical protein
MAQLQRTHVKLAPDVMHIHRTGTPPPGREVDTTRQTAGLLSTAAERRISGHPLSPICAWS